MIFIARYEHRPDVIVVIRDYTSSGAMHLAREAADVNGYVGVIELEKIRHDDLPGIIDERWPPIEIGDRP